MHVLCVDVVFSLHIEHALCKSPWASGLHLTRRGATHRIVSGVPANLTNRALRIVTMQVTLPGEPAHRDVRAAPGSAVDRRRGRRIRSVVAGIGAVS